MDMQIARPTRMLAPPPRSLAARIRSHPNAIRVVSVLVFFIAWEIFGRDVNPLFLSYPSKIFAAFRAITATGELQRAMWASFVPFALGVTISIVFGTIIGVLIAHFWWLEYTLDPFLNALYAVPRIALVPLVILWAGLETTGKVAILVSIAIFPMIINTYSGIKDVRGALLEIGRAYCASPLQIFWKITLPAATPYIMAGVRLTVGLAIIGMIVAEFFTAITGLGGLIVFYANAFATAKLFVPIIVIAVFGVALTELLGMVERRLLVWRTSEREHH
jgi:NitT/TauT family transport system permease protein